MFSKVFSILLVFLAMQSICSATSHEQDTAIDLSQYPVSVYNPETGVEYKAMIVNFKQDNSSVLLMYGGLPCHCENHECSCCASIRMRSLNWKMCLNAVIRPQIPPFTLSLIVNDKVIIQKTPGSEIELFCAGIRLSMKVCTGLKNIYIDKRNAHFCAEVHVKLMWFKISLFYKCININSHGISIENLLLDYNQTIPQIEYQPDEPEVYDAVDFEEQDLELYNTTNDTLSVDEEAQIGQLKL
ncbi:hypothetical protein WN48_10206 [Eufriesea mexicana]|uniref:uncharacterized protein LOC108554827 n=1 Tax=Eufriesea mexicana TaxID=516756 RepID=UPI00083BF43C|nr:PREDICTED: uncharacterized protein LOC108554827 [Eufriesea mexicana]OAD61723.1 hypothetical protein WN48_10206 [Eufriesea mexicana]